VLGLASLGGNDDHCGGRVDPTRASPAWRGRGSLFDNTHGLGDIGPADVHEGKKKGIDFIDRAGVGRRPQRENGQLHP